MSLLLFFFKMPKIWVGWTTLNREKKEDGLIEPVDYNIYMWDYEVSFLIENYMYLPKKIGKWLKSCLYTSPTYILCTFKNLPLPLTT